MRDIDSGPGRAPAPGSKTRVPGGGTRSWASLSDSAAPRVVRTGGEEPRRAVRPDRRTDPERCDTCCGDHGGSCGRLEAEADKPGDGQALTTKEGRNPRPPSRTERSLKGRWRRRNRSRRTILGGSPRSSFLSTCSGSKTRHQELSWKHTQHPFGSEEEADKTADNQLRKKETPAHPAGGKGPCRAAGEEGTEAGKESSGTRSVACGAQEGWSKIFNVCLGKYRWRVVCMSTFSNTH
ncbi:uncharacterized protein LOC106738024 [Alligator mississippiensis]|uniref:uncharacterized protein LOC106738024 n=1 Tax=Alligator mississippiensis TaxID=8496 RepID=UPI002877F16F|nr:uncharacterized protein LOC106738024 [Alligator mississippiensis]